VLAHRKHLTIPGYLLATVLISFSLVDGLLNVWPIRWGEVSWRYESVELLSHGLPTPLLAVAIAYFIALALDKGRPLRGIARFSWVFAAILVAAIPLFVHDTLLIHNQADPTPRPGFQITSMATLLKFFMASLFLIAIAFYGDRASKSGTTPKAPRIDLGTGIRETLLVPEREVPARWVATDRPFS
jgi:hypothetical protein